jgi:hypothetical protein
VGQQRRQPGPAHRHEEPAGELRKMDRQRLHFDDCRRLVELSLRARRNACADRQRRDARAPDRGFRCAASFDDVLGMLESGDLQRARFSECSGEGGGK